MDIDTNFRYVRVEELETVQAAIERALPLVLAASDEGEMEQIEEANETLLELKTASSFICEMLKRPE